MRILKIIISGILIIFMVAACAEGGGFYKEGKKFSLIRTIGAIGGAALAVQIAKEGGLGGGGGGPSYTGGPTYDWDMFSNGQYRCRTIAGSPTGGQFVDNSLCSGMPLDDDRWPNN